MYKLHQITTFYVENNNYFAFPCPRCNRMYKHRASLNSHLKLECGVAPQFRCIACGRQFTWKQHLKRHMVCGIQMKLTFGNVVRVKKNINIGRAYRTIKSLNVVLKKCFNVVFVINVLGINVVSILIWGLFMQYLHEYLMLEKYKSGINRITVIEYNIIFNLQKMNYTYNILLCYSKIIVYVEYFAYYDSLIL
eukprot:XP_016662402.1 PREDICTED: uncharacterized protein LOC100571278 isoform X1 [Acyrthosiphon pisum]